MFWSSLLAPFFYLLTTSAGTACIDFSLILHRSGQGMVIQNPFCTLQRHAQYEPDQAARRYQVVVKCEPAENPDKNQQFSFAERWFGT
jgi:hypothetical protein